MTQQIETPPDPYTPYSDSWIKLVHEKCGDGVAFDSADFDTFIYTCRRTQLDPLARQIYLKKSKSRGREFWSPMTGIDGYRLLADRTGQYAGNDDPVFDDEMNVCKATVTVYKLLGGVRCAFTASARWEQYYPGDAQGFMWKKMPHLMLGKCAEALALRKAFPAELSGIYIPEEMEQANDAPEDDKSTKKKDPPKADPKPAKEQVAKPAKSNADAPETYSGTEAQRDVMRKAFAKHGIVDNKDKHKIASMMQGKPMNHVDVAIKAHLAEHKPAQPQNEQRPDDEGPMLRRNGKPANFSRMDLETQAAVAADDGAVFDREIKSHRILAKMIFELASVEKDSKAQIAAGKAIAGKRIDELDGAIYAALDLYAKENG